MGTAVPVCVVYGMIWFRSGFSCLLNHRKSYVVVFLAEVFALIPVLIGLFLFVYLVVLISSKPLITFCIFDFSSVKNLEGDHVMIGGFGY